MEILITPGLILIAWGIYNIGWLRGRASRF